MYRGDQATTSRAYFEYLTGAGYPRWLVRLVFALLERSFRPHRREFQGRVLDVGCGIGHFFRVYPDAIGVDHNFYCVRYCVERGYRCIQGDLYHLPFPAESFDGVLLCHVLEHLEAPEAALDEVRRVLKPGGILSIRVPTATGFKVDRTHRTFFDYPRLVHVLMPRGFSIVAKRYYPIPWRALGELIVYNELRVLAVKKAEEFRKEST
jgi:SAM-dependent methyltransferase